MGIWIATSITAEQIGLHSSVSSKWYSLYINRIQLLNILCILLTLNLLDPYKHKTSSSPHQITNRWGIQLTKTFRSSAGNLCDRKTSVHPHVSRTMPQRHHLLVLRCQFRYPIILWNLCRNKYNSHSQGNNYSGPVGFVWLNSPAFNQWMVSGLMEVDYKKVKKSWLKGTV